METKLSQISRILLFHYYPAWLAYSGIYCLVFASMAWNPGVTFSRLFIESQFQILFIYFFIISALWILKPVRDSYRLVVIFSALVAGVLCSEALSALLTWPVTDQVLSSEYILLRIISGGFIVWCFLLAERYYLSERRLQRAKIDRLLADKKLTGNELQYLKSRIDPGFLFAKLQFILDLRDAEPDRAKAEQLELVRYLRQALAHTQITGERADGTF